MEQMETSIKTELEKEETFAARSSSEINLNFFKQDPGLLQSVKNEPSCPNDILIKEEILEDSSQDEQCGHAASTPTSAGRVKEACSTSLGDLLNVKYESAEMDVGPTVLQHMDSHYTINKNVSAATEEKAISVDCNEATSGRPVKEESVEGKKRDDSEHQCAQGPLAAAGAGSLYEANKMSRGGSLIVKQELEDIDIGPTVFQHMDIHYALNKNTVDDCNKPMLYRGVNKTVEDKLRDDSEQQCAEAETAAAGAGSSYEANDLSRGGSLIVKQELDDIDIGPTVFQHMDIHYALNKNTVDDYNKPMLYRGVNKSLEDKLRGNKIVCHACGKTFSKHLLSAHRKLHERNSATSGATSSSVTGPSNERRSETAKAESQRFKFDICEKRYRSEAILNKHKHFHSGLSVCHICRAKFNLKSKLTIHLRTHTVEKPYQCDSCDARFKTNGELTIHNRVHTGDKPYQCYTCNARFTTNGNLTTHKRVHTAEKPYKCDSCDARFKTNGELTTHKRVHTGEKPYQCDTCNARFTANGNLTTHKRVHTGEKLYQCVTCNARFTTNGELTIHNRVHTGEKPYQCDNCKALFTTKGELTRHKRVHTGEKPYQCQTCYARFATNSNLTKHKRVHTGEKPFKCTECDSKFTQRSNLNSHVRRHHPK